MSVMQCIASGTISKMVSSHAKPKASIITPLGEGGIGIIALTGEGAAGLLDRFFTGTKRGALDIAPGSIAHGRIRDGARTIDEVIVAHLDSELSGTGEPRFEVNCHGGVLAVRSVLECFERAGAEVVDWRKPGELQRWPEGAAVLSAGCIHQKALERLPRALTRLAVAMLLHQASGALTGELREIRAALAASSARAAGERLDALLATAAFGTALVRPWKAAIVGPPNAGKSTLLNALLRKERVLVHDRPGTTRDVVSELVSIDGVPLELMDSAGIRPPRGEIEAAAVARAANLVERCNVLLLLYDVRRGLRRALDAMPSLEGPQRILLIANKIDLVGGAAASEAVPAELSGCPRISVSAKEGTNLARLEAALLAPFKPHIGHCRGGGAVIFDGEIESAVARISNVLTRRGPGEALKVLDVLTGAAQEGPA